MERLTISGTKESKSNVTIREVLNKLAKYEDLEESGRLFWFNNNEFYTTIGKEVFLIEGGKIYPCYHRSTRIERDGAVIAVLENDELTLFGIVYATPHDFDTSIFLTREAAEAKLEEKR